MGGLGNQMFQYAAGRRLALQHRAELKLDLSFLQENVDVITVRNYELGHLGIRVSIATSDEVSALTGIGENRIKRILRKFISKSNPGHRHIHEPYFHFYPDLLDAPDNSYLEGYWQSERYFKDVDNIIRNEFSVVTKPDACNVEMAERIGSANSVSIHIRRGDYVSSNVINSYHGVCSTEFYRNAVKIVAERVTSPHFFVFSDDPLWAKENFRLSYETTYLDHNGSDKGYEDLRLMSLCRHCIVANSSFSWWGAWLCGNPDKIVIAPRRWFNVPDLNTDDLLPESWIRI